MSANAQAVPPDDFSAVLDECQRRVGHQFRDLGLLKAALTHASGAEHRLASNERLEFLGDAILGSIVCDLLYRRFPDYLEGDLTKIKSVVVSRQTCAKISRAMGMEGCLILGKGMITHPSVPPSLLADVFESLVAAIYLDGGVQAARQFVELHVGPEIEATAEGASGDNYKSLLQQLAQREFGTTPVYRLLDEKGTPGTADRAFLFCWGLLAARGQSFEKGAAFPAIWQRAFRAARCSASFLFRPHAAWYPLGPTWAAILKHLLWSGPFSSSSL